MVRAMSRRALIGSYLTPAEAEYVKAWSQQRDRSVSSSVRHGLRAIGALPAKKNPAPLTKAPGSEARGDGRGHVSAA